jgi:DNA replication and repair protein RecF
LQLQRIWLTDFRSYAVAELELAAGLTAVVGANGEGKTNLLEAIAYLATLRSFRGAPTEALIREGAPQAVIRAEGTRAERSLLVEAEINRTGRNRVQINKQRLQRGRDLLGALRVTVFAPDDLALIKGGPAGRREYLDDALVAVRPAHDALRADVDRVLRQRNALLKQAGGRLTAEVEATLDVWDAKLDQAGSALVDARVRLLDQLAPQLAGAYDQVAQRSAAVEATYVSAWREQGLAAALAAARRDDIRRGVSTVGPHRDEVELRIAGLPARTHASQGEQRSLAWALRLAAHGVVTEATDSAPILLLDDVFSELDPDRSAALLHHLPAGQTILSTASVLPPGAEPDAVVDVRDGTIAARTGSAVSASSGPSRD